MFFNRKNTNLSAAQLAEAMQTEQPPLILDVREAYECQAQPCPYPTTHIPLGLLPLKFQDLPKDKPIAVLCHSGGRSAMATQFLATQGYQASNISGGILSLIK